MIDSQSVKMIYASDERGFDGGKKTKGRKRHIVTDTMGNLLAVFDGTGQQWHTGRSDTVSSTLSVSTDKIDFNESAMIVQGNTLTDDAGSHLLSFVNDGTSLDAYLADADTAITWGVTFYPKGVANNLEPNNGVQIDNTKNIIVIWYSGMRVLTVFGQE